MTRRRTAIALAVLLLLVASLAMLLWPRTPTRTASGPAPDVGAPGRPQASPSEAPPPATPPVLEAAVQPGGPEAWFPDHAIHRCSAPDHLPEGRFVAGASRVLVRDHQVLVAGEELGSAPVLAMGTVVAHITWESGTCVVSEPFRFEVTGRVDGGGEHLVAGCPIGETVRTDASGSFRTTAMEGQPCMLRVVDVDGPLAMGPKVAVAATEDVDVVLAPPQPIDPRQVELGQDLLARMVVGRLERAEQEVRRWSALPQEDWVVWMREQAEAEVAFFTAEQQRLDDPAQAREAVAELLLGTNN